MLDKETKKKINDLRDTLVGKVPDPKSQVEQIMIALIYKFMNDMDKESTDLGGEASFFVGDFEKYSWDNLFGTKVSGSELVDLYSTAVESMEENPNIPQLFRDIFKNAYIPYKDAETLRLFLSQIDDFEYSKDSEQLGDAFEHILNSLSSQGDAGQFRTPRHIIDFIVEIVDPKKDETILDPASGTSGFLISAFKHIIQSNSDKRSGDLLSATERKKIMENINGYDISPDMVRIGLANMYLHGFPEPNVVEYDALTSEDRWNEYYDVILANPPFMTPKGGIRPHNKFGNKSSKAEVLFVDYILTHLTPKGRAGIIVPEGIIFQKGKAYIEIRKKLIANGLVGVISLPGGVFNPYSGVKTSILIIDKSSKSEDVYFVKVENDGFTLSAQRKSTQANDLPDLLPKLKNFRKTKELDKVSKSKLLENEDIILSNNLNNLKSLKTKYQIEKLENLIEILSGYAFKSKHFNEIEGKPLIRIRDILSNNTKTFYTGEYDEKYTVKKGDLLVGMDGDFHIGIWEGPEALLNQRVCVLKPGNKILKEYLYHVIQKPIKDINENTFAVTVKHISTKQIKQIEIPLPPLQKQQEILDEISRYKSEILKANQVIENSNKKIEASILNLYKEN